MKVLPGPATAALFVFTLVVTTFAATFAGPDLVVVDSPPAGTAGVLLEHNVAVVWNGGDFLLAVADGEEVARFRSAGLAAHPIDRNASDATYYVVSPVPPDRLPALAARSRVVWSKGGRVVVDIPDERLRGVLDAGFDVARLFLRPIRLPRRAGPLLLGEPAGSFVAELVDSVSGERIDAHVLRLQNFGTRHASSDSAYAAVEYILQEFVSYGIDSVGVHDWSSGMYAPNVVAVIPGVTRSEELVVVGAHYDSYAQPSASDAPGADDNASGTALVLECARVLARAEFARTLVFLAFGAEEFGLLGSHAWVTDVAVAGELDIVAMLNADMIGYSASSELDLSLIVEPDYLELWDVMIQVGADHVPELPLEPGRLLIGTSDHASFWLGGYHAIMFFEDTVAPCPYIHTSDDRVGLAYNAPLLAGRTTQLGVAFLATLADRLLLSVQHDPLSDTEDTVNPYRVTAEISSPYTLDADSLLVRYAVDGSYTQVPLTPTGAPGEYEATIPAQSAGRFVNYYLVAGDQEGGRVTDPKTAPDEVHEFFVGTVTDLFVDDFEASSGWRVRLTGDDATSGIWTLDDPNGTGLDLGQPLQPEHDHTPGDEARFCYFTGNAPPGAPIGEEDVDGGRTTLQSPILDLSGHENARLTYFRWFSNSASPESGADRWIVSASPDDGVSWVELERLTENCRRWERVEHELTEYIPLTSEVLLRFIAADEGEEDIVEAAIDDVSVRSYEDSTTPIDPTPPAEAPMTFARLVVFVPNPYGVLDEIRLGMPEPARHVTVRIYDVGGRLVRTLIDGRRGAGAHTLGWDGRDAAGRPMPSGRYFVRIRAGAETITAALMLVH